MSSDVANRLQRERRQDRRLLVLVVCVSALVATSVFASVYGPTYLAIARYSPQDGDILFQSLPHSRLVNAIEGATESPYSHCGIVGQQNGRWVVYEAYRKVEQTPLNEFIFRGRDHGFAVSRLNTSYQTYVPETLNRVREYLGRPYDSRYRMDDERIYCSELIYKAFQQASGEQLGKLVPVRNLNWRPYESTIRHYENAPVPLDRQMITPKHLGAAPQLEPVYNYRLTAASQLPPGGASENGIGYESSSRSP